jgi:hypothetical protein
MRRILTVALGSALMCTTAFVGTAHAITGVTKKDTVNYKYVGVTGPDSSTCGGNWANDTETRTFQVYKEQANNGTYEVYEKFTAGKFVAIDGPSPQSCADGNSNTVSSAVKGSFHGYIVIYVSNTNKSGAWDPSTDVPCSATCTTTEWITNAFGSSATISEPDWWFSYKANAKASCSRHWINANYGDSGDIASGCSVS